MTLAGCGGGTDSKSTTTPGIDHGSSAPVIAPLYMDALGIVPTHGSYTIHVNNLGDDHYTLESISVTDAKGKDQSGVIKVAGAMCQRLTAKNSCSIEFTPKTAKSTSMIMTVKLKNSKGELETVRQMIRISDKLAGTKGLSFEPQLGNVVTASGDYNIAIPVTLNEDFDKVEAFNGSLSCNSAGFKKGNACTYLISGHALTDNTTLSAQLTGYRNKKVVSSQSNNITVRTGSRANLLLAPDISIVGDGATPSDIMVYNTGNAEVTGITYDKNLPEMVLSSTACATIAGSGSCLITATVASETHASGYVEATYKPVSTAATTSTAGANVTIHGNTNIGLTLIHAHGDFEDTLVGDYDGYGLEIYNNQNKLTNLKYSLLNPGKGMEIVNPGSCPTELEANSTCQITITYEPTAHQAPANAEILITGTYIGTHGETKTYKIKHTVPYSAVATTNVLAITKPHDLHVIAGEIPENGGADSTTATISRTIAGNLGIKLTALGFETPITDLAITNPAGACTVGEVLTKDHTSCIAHINYGPIAVPRTTNSTKLKVDYTFGRNNTKGQVLSQSFDAKVDTAHADVRLLTPVVMEHGGHDVHGDGSFATPYQFTALKGLAPVSLTYTFKNTGNVDALDFSLNKGSMAHSFPIGVKVSSNTCSPTPGSIRTLTKNETCTVVVEVPDSAFLFQSDIANTSSTVIPQNAGIQLPFSVNYTDVGGNSYNEAEATQYVQFNRNWANVSYATTSIVKAEGKWHIVIKATAANTGSHFPITIKPLTDAETHMDQADKADECTILNATDNTCDVNIELAVNKHHAEDDNFIVTMEVTNPGLANDIIHDNHVVAYSDALATVNVTKMWEQPKFKGIISHGAGENLPFEVEFLIPEASGAHTATVIAHDDISGANFVTTIISDTCKVHTVNSVGKCTIKGNIKMPATVVSNLPTPVNYKMKLDLELNENVPEVVAPTPDVTATASTRNTAKHLSYTMQESGQTVISLNNKVNETQTFSQQFGGYDWFNVYIDDTILQGPINSAATGANTGFNAIKINANNVATGQAQNIFVYASRANGGYNNYLITSSQGSQARISYMQLSTKMTNSDGWNLYLSPTTSLVLYDRTLGDLNAKVPAGHYKATFFLRLSGNQPIKVDLDWTKTTPAGF